MKIQTMTGKYCLMFKYINLSIGFTTRNDLKLGHLHAPEANFKTKTQ